MAWDRMKKYIFLTLIMSIYLLLAGTGCRTAHGFGEDMENAGEKIQEKTDK
jgi:predicted small secreted protein